MELQSRARSHLNITKFEHFMKAQIKKGLKELNLPIRDQVNYLNNDQRLPN